MSENGKLAIHGGEKAVKALSDGRFHFGKEEKEAVCALFDRSMETGDAPGYNGPEEEAFCQEFAAELGGGYADGVNSGTNAVFTALRALDLPPFSEVIVGCVTDPGGAMPVILNGCIPVPADTARGHFSPGAAEIEARITERTSAVIVAHISGEPADMPAIMEVARKHHLPVIEDCAQAHGAEINGRRVGTFGDIGTFSLMFGKHICTGGQGGAVFTKDEDMYWRIRRAADRGKPFGLDGHTNLFPSLNCNMDEIHAAIGRVQLKKLNGIVAKRRAITAWLREHGLNDLKCLSFPTDDLPAGFRSSFWFWQIHFRAENAACTKEEFLKALREEGLPVQQSYRFALSFEQEWFRNRSEKFPWNNPLYKGDPCAEYPCPNALAAMKSDFLMDVNEHWDEDVLKQTAEAFLKVGRYYSK